MASVGSPQQYSRTIRNVVLFLVFSAALVDKKRKWQARRLKPSVGLLLPARTIQKEGVVLYRWFMLQPFPSTIPRTSVHSLRRFPYISYERTPVS